jgi:hypothetical protein
VCDIPRNGRDALDLAGKLPLALKALEIGLRPEQLLLDSAQVTFREDAVFTA